jgi:hypothetical protein
VLSYFGSDVGFWTSQDRFPRFVADVDGGPSFPGRADIVGFSSNGVVVSMNQGGGQFLAPQLILPYFGSDVGFWTSQDRFPRMLADVNGDGRADIVGFSSNGVVVSLSQFDNNGQFQFTSPELVLPQFGTDTGGWTSQDQYPRMLGDVNGDGMADIVGFSSTGAVVSLATGGGRFAQPTSELAQFGTNAGGWTSQDRYPRMLADVNGDRMADIVGFSSSGAFVSLATGGGHFAQPTFESAQFGIDAGGWTSQNQYPRMLGDVTGDGRADIVGFASTQVNIGASYDYDRLGGAIAPVFPAVIA